MIRHMHSYDTLDREVHFAESGVRGKYAGVFARSRNVRILAPDLLDAFPDSESVNEALRTLIRVSARRAAAPTRPKKART